MYYIPNKQILQVVSGGQTGADVGGLYAALHENVPTGGYAAECFKTSEGPKPELGELFGLIDENLSYQQRTEKNVLLGDGTVLFVTPNKTNSPGSVLTRKLCAKYRKPIHSTIFILSESESDKDEHAQDIIDWLKVYHQIGILNVAGNREIDDGQQAIQRYVYDVMRKVLRGI